MIKEILLLGNTVLYERCDDITAEDSSCLDGWITDLKDTLMEYRRVHGAGRAISAPQIGIKKRLIYMETDRPYVFINPSLSFPDNEEYEVLDDCMSFPGLCVRVMRKKRAVIEFLNREMISERMGLEGDYSELLQHECDHLDGILATMRAKDERSFFFMEMKREGL